MVQPAGQLLAATNNPTKSGWLERMLKNFTTSYKLFWFRGVLDEVCSGSAQMPLRRIAARMVASAWYPVVYFRLSLGFGDQLANCVDCALKVTALTKDSSPAEIIAAIESSDDKTLSRNLKKLIDYVPYRLIRPFYDKEFGELRQQQGAVKDSEVNYFIIGLNQRNSAGELYVFGKGQETLTVNPDWVEFLRDNQTIVSGWLDMKLVEYLQARNPSVPAISAKLYAPQKRDLAPATKYWLEALKFIELRDIYSGRPLNSANFDRFGQLSIDHFIPWSFVLHDEPWNLTPIFKNENSSKSDKLPSLESFLEPFANQQFDALMAVRNTGRHKKYIERYLTVDANVLTYELRLECRELFRANLERTIKPLHQIALNQGFSSWHFAE